MLLSDRHADHESGIENRSFESTPADVVIPLSGEDPPPFERTLPHDPRNVLVVDDERVIRQLIARVLRRNQYAPDEACNGREALAKLARSFFHSIVLDLMMPFVNGLDVIRALAAERRWCDSVVVVSAASDNVRQQLASFSCVHSVLPKPFELRELVVHVGGCRGSR